MAKGNIAKENGLKYLEIFSCDFDICLNQLLLNKVNEIIHPAVEEYILNDIANERKAGNIDVFFLEAALLIEAGYVPYLDELWYIYTEKSVRIKRLKESRAYSDEKIEQIMIGEKNLIQKHQQKQ